MQQEETGSNKKEQLSTGTTRTIPVIHEELEVGKKVVESGRVRITKSVSEEQETINIPLVHEEVEVHRVSVNQFIDESGAKVRYEGNTTIIPIVREVMVKRLMLVEEIHVTKRQVETHHSEKVNLLKEDIDIERIENSRSKEDI